MRDNIQGSNNLQVLDLSGATNLKHLDCLKHNQHLVALELSRTHITSLDGLPCQPQLRKLMLRRCTRIVKLITTAVIATKLPFLEVLDISGCENLSDLPGDLSQLIHLKELNLSGCSSLQQLGDDCLFGQMSSLEKLDLSQTQFNDFPSFSNLTNLQILNLSQTAIAQVLDVSELVNLKELLLANCQRLQVLPDVRALTSLQTLDLSLPDDFTINDFQVKAESQCQRHQFLSGHSRLQKLVLTNRPRVLKLFPEVSLDNSLQYLDLSTGLKDVVGVQSSVEETVVDTHPSLVQRNISKCNEIHLVSTFFSISSGCDRYILQFCELSSHIRKIRTKFIVVGATTKGSIQSEVLKKQYERIGEDLEYIKDSISRLQASGNRLSSEKLLHQLLDVAKHLSEVDSPLDNDYTELIKLLRIVAKVKLLVPRGPEKNGEPPSGNLWFDFDEESVLKEETIPATYESLSEVEKKCLFYFLNTSSPQMFDKGRAKRIYRMVPSIQNRTLIQWWISEGLTTDEETGKQIVRDLEEKLFIVRCSRMDKKSRSSYMVPSVHSLVTQRAAKEGFFDFHPRNHNSSSPPHLTHLTGSSKWVCLLRSRDDNSPEELDDFTAVRALFNISETMIDIKPEWFSKMRNLSLLHLGNLGCTETAKRIVVTNMNFLEELKNMKQLHFLSLEGFPTLTKLPASVCEISNLQVLSLRDCSYLEELPAGIGSLKNLTHLDLTNSRLISMLPKGISSLSKLEVLKGFVIYYQEGGRQHKKACTLRDLVKLKNLRKLNLVVNRDLFPDGNDVRLLQNMENLSNLSITWQKSYGPR